MTEQHAVVADYVLLGVSQGDRMTALDNVTFLNRYQLESLKLAVAPKGV